MTRGEFLQKCAILGISAPFLSVLLESCGEDGFYPDFNVNFSGKVIIIGAGAAGLTAGYLLDKYNIDYQIIEASGSFGGRLKRTSNFADFPIDLGAEWIHEDPSVLGRLLSDPTLTGTVDVLPYSPDSISNWNEGELISHNWGNAFYSEYKFKSTTWFGYFENYFVPKIGNNIVYNSPVSSIDYSGNQVVVTDTNNNTYQGDRVLVTVPITILQNGSINFNPGLPADKITAINDSYMPDGIKVFVEFTEKFYPDIVLMGPLFDAFADTNHIYYDAAFRKDSTRNILGLFAVGDPATPYSSLPTDQDIFNKILGELDQMFNGKATQTYVKHVIQNWSKEPYIRGSYSHDIGNEDALLAAVDNKVYFAGEAYSVENGATVPGAAESAYAVIEQILQG